jgi:hypothetical protein
MAVVRKSFQTKKKYLIERDVDVLVFLSDVLKHTSSDLVGNIGDMSSCER